jgi:hypothetical protein
MLLLNLIFPSPYTHNRGTGDVKEWNSRLDYINMVGLLANTYSVDYTENGLIIRMSRRNRSEDGCRFIRHHQMYTVTDMSLWHVLGLDN